MHAEILTTESYPGCSGIRLARGLVDVDRCGCVVSVLGSKNGTVLQVVTGGWRLGCCYPNGTIGNRQDELLLQQKRC